MNILQRIRLPISSGRWGAGHENSGQRRHFQNFVLHFRPRNVPERTLRLSLTWGLGGTAVVLVFMLFGTGLMLKFVYEPFPDRAYDSIVYLNSQVPFGQLVRNIHRWSANGLLFVVFLHFLRIFFTGAYAAPRQFNWIIGLILLTAAILSNFTGYLLPWDQLAYWAITISTSMLDYIPGIGAVLKEWIVGGAEPGAKTLMNFYAIHTAVLPALLLFFLPFHFWRIRKAGGLVIPRAPGEDPSARGPMIETMPHLIVREVAMALMVFAVILVTSMLFDAPLADQANPGLSPNPTKAPWYFMGIQEILMHFHPVFALLVIPMLVVAGLFSLPFVNKQVTTSGIWFCSRKGRKMALAAAVISMLATVGAVLLDEFVLSTYPAGPNTLTSNGLLPFLIVLSFISAFYFLIKKGFRSSNNEAIQALFSLVATAFVVLTIIGIWFRGPGMQLMWAG